MKSLLIIGHPKGFTSKVYFVCRQATGLAEVGVSAGELLNWERNSNIEPRPFVDDSDETFACYEKHLLGVPPGHIIKDVVQPHVIIRFLDKHPGQFNVLYIHRDADEVMITQRLAGWGYYPDPRVFEPAFRKHMTIEYSEAIVDPEAIFKPLRALGYPVRRFSYITEEFKRRRDQATSAIRAYRLGRDAREVC